MRLAGYLECIAITFTLFFLLTLLSFVWYTFHAQDADHHALQASILKLEKNIARQQITIKEISTQQERSMAHLRELLNSSALKQLEMATGLHQLHHQHADLTHTLSTSALWEHYVQTYDTVRRRLHAEVAALQTPPDCRQARYLACYIITRSCGFACQMHTLSDCMVSGLLSGRTSVLLPPQLFLYAPECNYLWDCFFLPISPCNAFAEDAPADAWKNWTANSTDQFTIYTSWGEDPYRLPAFVSQQLNSPLFRDLSFIPTPSCLLTGVLLQWCMRPGARLQKAIDKRLRQLDLVEKPCSVGLHIRRTDKVQKGSLLQPEAMSFDLLYYMMHVDHFVGPTTYHHAPYGRQYGQHVLVVADNDVRDEVKPYKAYNFTIALPGQGRWPQEALDVLIADVFSLARNPFFVGTLSSQVSRLVAELRAAASEGAESFKRMASLDDGYYIGQQPRTLVRPATLRTRLFLQTSRLHTARPRASPFLTTVPSSSQPPEGHNVTGPGAVAAGH